MKKIILSFAVVAAFSLLLFSACKKGKEALSPESQQTASIQSQAAEAEQSELQRFYNEHGPKYQPFTVDAKQGGKIRLKGGTTITIPANAFTIGGVPVAGGVVKLEVLELYDRASLALSGINTLTDNGTILESDGSFDLKATANGVQVDDNLAAGKVLKFEVPDRQQAGPTNLFRGGPVDVQNPNGQRVGEFGWRPEEGPAVIPVNNTFGFTWPRLRWINCDRTWVGGNGSFSTLYVNLINNTGTLATYSQSGAGGGTYVFLIPQGDNALVQIYTQTGVANQVKSYVNSIPQGIYVKVFAFSIVGGAYSSAYQDFTTTGPTQSISLTLTPTTAADLEADLANLSTF